MSKYKYHISITVLSCLSIIPIVGCGSNSTNPQAKNINDAINYAIRVFERYSGSHIIMSKGQPEIILTSIAGNNAGKLKSLQQKLNKLTESQQKEFDDALKQLERFINSAPSDPAMGKTIALAKAVAGKFHLYNGHWLLNTLTAEQVKQSQLHMQIHQFCLEIKSLKSEQDTLKPAVYQNVISKTTSAIKMMQMAKRMTQNQLKQVEDALANLIDKLNAAIRQRDTLNIKIGNLKRKMDSASAKEALMLQKVVNKLENKRFTILTRIQKLRTGPYTLNKAIDIGFPSQPQTLKTIGGIEQLKQEKKRLEVRLKKINDAIKLQKEYLQNINSQMKIALSKSQAVAQQLDKLIAKLKKQLALLQDTVVKRNSIAQKADTELSEAIKLSKQAMSDINNYFSAVRQASSKVSSSGRTDNFLKELSESQPIIFSINNLYVNASLAKAELVFQNITSLKSVTDILKYANGLVAIPQKLANIFKSADTELQKLSAEQTKLITQALTTCQKNVKSAKSNTSTILKIQYAAALYQASIIAPAQASEYIAQAKSLLNEILSSNKAGGNDSLLVPARQLQEQLTL